MQVTLTKSTKPRKGSTLVYAVAGNSRLSVRVAKSFFKNGTAPDSFDVVSDALAEPKAKLTAEQRKEARKNAPKLSPAEKLAKLQERAAKLLAKINAVTAQPAPAE